MKNIKIEDFHVGFEYEQFILNVKRFNGTKENLWLKKTYNLDSARLSLIHELIETGSIRHVQPCVAKQSIHDMFGVERSRRRKINFIYKLALCAIFALITIIVFANV